MTGTTAVPAKFRSLSVKFFRFTACLVLWIVSVVLAYDIRQGNFNPGKGLLLCLVVLLVAYAIARFTINLLIKPIRILQYGMEEVGQGNLKRIKFAPTGDEIEFLARSFNDMIKRLSESQKRLVQHQEELEQKVKERTLALEEAMQKAMEASSAKSEFLANMSHELRTPMNGLLGMIELSLDAPSSMEQKEQMETAQRCALSLLSLVNDVLDLSKIESGKMAFETINFDLASTLEDTLKGHEVRARQKGVLLEWHFGDLPEEVSGDPLRLRQIVNNLVSNSIKFTSEGAIQVKASARNDADGAKWIVELDVIDTGTGIPQEKLATIFEKFTQVDGSISRRYGGTGLGLAITKRLIELQSGSISVESELGLGSKFSVVLQYDCAVAVQEEGDKALHPAPAVTQEEQRAKQQEKCGAILLVEDNVVNQRVVMAVLKKRGYEIDVASNGIEALAKLEQRNYSVVLMDVQMPVMDGLEATRRMRQNEKWKDTPVIAMTAHAMTGDKERCIAAGMNAYISKPVHSAHLIATLEAYYSRPANKEEPHQNDLMKPFLARAQEGLAELRKSVEAADLSTLEEQVRHLREAAEAISATGVAESAKRVQTAIESGNPDAVTHGLLLLEGELTRLRQTEITITYATT